MYLTNVFRGRKPLKDLKEKIKEEEARKGVAGISGIGINLPKFQQAQLGLTANELSPKGKLLYFIKRHYDKNIFIGAPGKIDPRGLRPEYIDKMKKVKMINKYLTS